MDDINGIFTSTGVIATHDPVPLPRSVQGTLSTSGEVLNVIDTFTPAVAIGSTISAVGQYSEIPNTTDRNTSVTCARITAADFIAVRNDIFVWNSTPIIENMVEIENTGYYRFKTLQAHAKGPQDTGQPISALDLGDWFISVSASGCKLTKPSGQIITLGIDGVEQADHIDLGFDQNGGLLVVFTVAGNIKLYWYNPQAGQIQVDDLGPGTTPYISLSSYNVILNTPEVLLVYSRSGDIRYRRQNDRYDTEYSLDVGDVGAILNSEFDNLDRYIIEYFDVQSGKVRNISTHEGTSWTLDKVTAAESEAEVVSFIVREGIVYPTAIEDVPGPQTTIQTDLFDLEEITWHYVDQPAEELAHPSAEVAIQELRVTDGTYSVSPESETVSFGTAGIDTLTITSQPALISTTAGEDTVAFGMPSITTLTVTLTEE